MIGLQDALQEFNKGISEWYGWIDIKDGEVYSNLKLIKDTATMPSEEEVNAKIAELNVIKARVLAYGSTGSQLDMQYWDSVNGTTIWADHIAQVKSDNPKPS
nr:gp40 [uncultured Mediterranean phage uvMED]